MALTPRVLIVGAAGQVGQALRTAAPANVELHTASHADLDIGAADQVASYIAALKPTLIINAAVYTAVDKAESDPAAAARVSADGVRNLANATLAQAQARLIHTSTDIVFEQGIRRTLAWYVANETWWRQIMDRRYRDYIQTHYVPKNVRASADGKPNL